MALSLTCVPQCAESKGLYKLVKNCVQYHENLMLGVIRFELHIIHISLQCRVIVSLVLSVNAAHFKDGRVVPTVNVTTSASTSRRRGSRVDVPKY